MPHRKRGRKLSRTTAHRKALRKNMAMALFEHGRITTTLPKAKEMRSFVEKIITLSRNKTLANYRKVLTRLQVGGGTGKSHDAEPSDKPLPQHKRVPRHKRVARKLFEACFIISALSMSVKRIFAFRGL